MTPAHGPATRARRHTSSSSEEEARVTFQGRPLSAGGVHRPPRTETHEEEEVPEDPELHLRTIGSEPVELAIEVESYLAGMGLPESSK